MEHNKFMMRAIELAEKGTGFVNPNPRVGAVIVKDDRIIAEGWHHKFGLPHAEAEAIQNAGKDDFTGCTIYVNLEPCSHYGKTPPCADLIIAKNFSRVVIGIQDQNPVVSGNGIKKLRDAGIEVITDICREEAFFINRTFFKFINKNEPYIMLKIGQSLDGCIGLNHGKSEWFTSDESRRHVHKLRSEFDAVLVGKTTVLKDKPLLTVREVEGRNPLRVICDTNLSLPLDTTIFKLEDNSQTIVCCNEEASNTRKARNLSLSGVNILPVQCGSDVKLLLPEVVKTLSDNFEITSLMIEGGAAIFSSFIVSGLVDELQIFSAPKVMGTGISPFASLNIPNIKSAPKFELKKLENCGGDIHAVLFSKKE